MTYTNIINVIDTKTIIKGFVCKPGMIVIGGENIPLTICTRTYTDCDHDNELYALYAYQFIKNEWKGGYLDFSRVSDNLIEEIENLIQEEIKKADDQAFKKVCDEALQFEEEMLVSCDDDEYFKFVTVVGGNKCNNGGEYWFYDELYPTIKKGVFKHFTTTSCDFDNCGCGFEGYVVLTNEILQKLIVAEEEVLERGCLY
jgi:hypothetical protein